MTWQKLAYFALGAAVALTGTVLFQRGDADADAPPYTIDHGVVDAATGIGYLRYTGNCLWCHGPDANGSSFGPALVDSLKTLTYDQFLEVVQRIDDPHRRASRLRTGRGCASAHLHLVYALRSVAIVEPAQARVQICERSL